MSVIGRYKAFHGGYCTDFSGSGHVFFKIIQFPFFKYLHIVKVEFLHIFRPFKNLKIISADSFLDGDSGVAGKSFIPV